MKRLLLFTIAGLVIFTVPAHADPGPGDEVVLITGNCADGTTTVSAHNTLDITLRYLIRIDGQIVEQGSLAPDERVERTYQVPLGESQFFRIRLGLTGDGAYFSTEGATDRTDCPSPSTTTPPPTSTPPTSTPPTSTPPTSTPPSGNSGHTKTPTVKGTSGSRPTASGGTAFTGSEDMPWLIAAVLGLLIVGVAALRIGSRKEGSN
jgi:hypothetical protein